MCEVERKVYSQLEQTTCSRNAVRLKASFCYWKVVAFSISVEGEGLSSMAITALPVS